MKWTHAIPLSVFLIVGAAATTLILVAMFITDQGEESSQLIRALGVGRASAASSAASAMELQGRWLGMSLAAADSSSAKAIGVREGESGVVVVDIASQGSERARAAGLNLGDRITSIDSKPVRNMADLYNVSRVVSPATATLVEVRRGDFPMTLVMPAMAMSPGLGVPRPETEGAAVPGAALPAAWANGQWYCPRERVLLPPGSVGPGMRCPRCQSPVQPYGRTWP